MSPGPVRKKLLRQNRDLAKSNNLRALKIRELENDCACMLSENLELRGRILELEKELEDNDARRIADHALAIKAKLESQLTEWGTLLAGLGLEPPMKRHSPRPRKSSKPRLSFSSARPSPSQRRLRDIAREIEELGHISETKSYPRQSMNPEQILALRSEANEDDSSSSVESPELGPPPVSKFIDEDPVKIDSPSRSRPTPTQESPKTKLAPPEALTSPQSSKTLPRSPSPEKKKKEEVVEPQETQPTETKPKETKPEETNQPETKVQKPLVVEAPAPQPVKTGSKRKLAARDDLGTNRPQKINNENENPRIVIEKQSIREKAGGRTLKELASIRKEARERANATGARKPLAAKSTNDDMSSPKKSSKPVATDEVVTAKADLVKSMGSQDRQKLKLKAQPPVIIEAVLRPEPTAPAVTELPCELGTPMMEQALLSPSSPGTAASKEAGRGATPPPIDINATREPSRPSRRNRTAVSYAEPNLRDKMRRPTKEMLDAVAGEGKYARRSSVAEQSAPDTARVKRESEAGDSWKKLPAANMAGTDNEPGSIPASPLAGKGSPPELPESVAVRGGRRSSMMVQELAIDRGEPSDDKDTKEEDPTPDSTGFSEVDIYEFTPSSPQPEKQAPVEPKKRGRKPLRRVSSAIQSDEGLAAKERASSRRRSMML
ncbi:Shugoshin [Fusarium albosuccineum]|uniref:Shugoshin n=2 Tax=Fusarium decemcellulare species complex TaxID=1329916 RepID=A0A8H4LGN2_9HYPO|nr:Shugoshin [Fusarium albosuccineum]